jgi:hypothetical protein
MPLLLIFLVVGFKKYTPEVTSDSRNKFLSPSVAVAPELAEINCLKILEPVEESLKDIPVFFPLPTKSNDFWSCTNEKLSFKLVK